MTVFATNSPSPRILVLAPNWLGDVIMMTPLLALLHAARFGPHQQPPELMLAVRNRWSPLFHNDKRLGATLLVARSGRHGGLTGLLPLAHDLQQLKPDAVILGPPSLRVAIVALLARIPLRVGFRTDGRALLLNEGLSFPGKGHTHFSEQLLSLGKKTVSRLGGEVLVQVGNEELLPGFHPSPVGVADGGPPVWALGVGTTYGEAKVWPRRHVLAFLQRAVEDFGVRVVLLGEGAPYGTESSPRGRLSSLWRHEVSGPAGVVDLVGRTTLAEVGGILQTAEVFVGNDSGLMHLAGALGTPTVGIFGSSNPRWTAPLGPKTRVVSAAGFACSPCFRTRCNQQNFCLDSITAGQVLRVLVELLGRKPVGSEGSG